MPRRSRRHSADAQTTAPALLRLERRIMLADGSILKLTVGSPVARIAAFDVPATAAGISLNLARPAAGPTDYVRVSLGDGDSAVQLGTFSMSSVSATAQAMYVPIPAALRGRALTLEFQLVSGSATPTAVAEISSIATVADLVGPNKDRSAALSKGATAFNTLADDLGRFAAFDQALPLLMPGGEAAKISDLISVPDALKAAISRGVQQYLASTTAPTAAGLADYLKAQTPAGYTISFSSLTASSTDAEVRFTAKLTVSRTTTGLLPDLGAPAATQGIDLDPALKLSATATLTADLAFGVKLSDAVALPGSFFLRLNSLGVAASVNGTKLTGAVEVGLLSASVAGGAVQVTATATGTPLGVAANVDLNLAQLQSLSANEILALTTAGSYTIDLPVSASLGPSIPPLAGRYKLTKGALFTAASPVDGSTGLAALTRFNSLRPSDLVDMFGMLGNWMGDLQGSALLSTSIPFLQGLDLGETLDFRSAFNTAVLSKIADTAGVAKFDSVQGLLAALSAAAGARYNTGTSVLTIPIQFGQDLAPLTGPKLDLGSTLGGLAVSQASATKVSVARKVTGTFTLGIDFTPLGTGVTIAATTPLASLNGGKGIAPVGDALAIEVQLADGTRLTISLAGSATLGDVAARISAAAPAKLKATVDAVDKRLSLIDMSVGTGAFAVRTSGASLAAVGLGLVGRAAAVQGTTRVIGGAPLHGDSIAKHVFVVPDSSTTPAKMGGTATVTVTGISGAASLGLVGMTIANGTASATASLSLALKDLAPVNGRVTLPELADAIDSAAANASLSGQARFDLPVTVQPAGLLPATAGVVPTISVDWTDPSLFLADGAGSNGQPLATNAKSILNYNAAAARLKTLSGLSYASVEAGLNALASYFQGPSALKALTSQLPLVDLDLGELLGLSRRFRDFVVNLGTSAPQSLADLASNLQAAFNVPGAVVKMTWDDSATAPGLKFSFVFASSASDSRPINLSLTGGRTLFDVSQKSNLQVSATASATVDFGLDLTNPAAPKPFLYDTTKLTLTAAVRSTAIDFSASVGPIGVFVHGSATKAATATFDADGLPGGAPASYAISFPKVASGRYYFSGNVVASSVQTLVGAARATLPVFYPVRTAELSKPVEFGYNLATGATTLTTPFDTGLPAVDLGTNLDALGGALADGLTKLKANLAQQLALFKIPLIGTRVTDSLSFIDQFRDAVTSRLKSQGSTPLDLNAVKAAINAALGSSGLNWGGSVLSSASLLADGTAEFKLNLTRALTSQTGDLAFDLGLPGLGLKLNNSRVAFSAGFEFALGFGLSKTGGFYIISDPAADELKVTASADATAFDATGTMGFFKVRATKPTSQAIHAGATFVVNLKDPSGTDNRITLADLAGAGYARLLAVGFGKDALGRASGLDVNLNLQAGFASAALPALSTGLHVKWVFAPPSGGVNPLTGSPTVKFDDVSVQLGEILRNTIGPVLGNISKTIAPVKPVIDMLTAPIPVISDLMGRTISLADLAALFGRGDIAEYAYAAKRVSELSSLIASAAATNSVNLGGFDFSLSTSATNLSGVTIGNILAPPKRPVDQANSGQKQFFSGGGSDNAGLVFPLLENPTSVFNLLLGREVDLVQFDMPRLDVEFFYKQFFPIIGPLGAQITGRVGATAQFGFGLDTYGLTSGGKILDGFYVKDLDRGGVDVPEAQLYASLTAGAELNLAVASAGVEGGIFANIDFNLHDYNGDGKIRLVEFQQSLDLGPIYVFDVAGQLDVGLQAYAEVDLWFWSERWEHNIARRRLLDFNLKRPVAGVDAPAFDPGQVDASGRLNLTTTNDDDTYRILPGTKVGEVVIQTRGQLFTRANVKTVAFDGKGGSDSIFVDPAVKLLAGGTLSLSGGEGDDSLTAGGLWAATLLGGNGNDSLVADAGKVYMDGGEGADQLSAGSGAATMLGGGGPDQLTGGAGAASMDGGAGDDYLIAGAGAVTMIGGTGNDQLSAGAKAASMDGGAGDDVLMGGPGADTMKGGAGKDVLQGGEGNDQLDGGIDTDSIYGGEGDDSIIGGDGDDSLSGDAGKDTILAGLGNDTLNGGDGNDILTGGRDLIGGAGDDVLSGGTLLIGGAGNDKLTSSPTLNSTLIGGEGRDTITAGSGHDRIWGDETTPGAAGDDIIVAGGGDDVVIGGGGVNSIDAGTGDDLIYAGSQLADDPSALGANTIIGGQGNDTLYGGAASDRIDAGEGSDFVRGNGGDDTLLGGAGSDTLLGGTGADSIEGGDGDDSIDGGDGADRILAGLGNDAVDAGRGDDLIIGGPDAGSGDNDTLIGGAGADTISGGAGNDVLVGDAGVPYLGAGGTASGLDAYGADLISGGAGADAIYGQGGADILYGNDGGDEIYGGLGNDLIHGGRDNDLLEGGDGADRVYGGTGADVLKMDTDASYLVTGDVIEGYGGNGMLVNADGTTRADVEMNDRLTATDVLLIAGTAGNDRITVATSASDAKKLEVVVNGGRVNTVTWRAADNVPNIRQVQVTGLAGNDRIDLSKLDSVGIALAAGGQYVTGLFGGDGDDTLIGTSGRDQIFGQAGSDWIYGGAGDDRLWGDGLGGGDAVSDLNRIFGGAGNDDLIGGQGSNYLYAWSSDPAAAGGKPYGVFSDLATRKFEDTGLDRMLGGPRGDSFYGSNNVAFMYGAGGYDVIYNQAGVQSSAQDTGLNSDQWKEEAQKSDRVWYLPATGADDEIIVKFDGKEHVIEVQTTNGGASTLWKTYRLSNPEYSWNGRATSAEQFKIESVVAPGEYTAATQAGLYQTAAGWGGALAGPSAQSDFDVILIDAFGGKDKVTVDVGVYKPVWIDGGAGDDVITVKANRAILPDQFEGLLDPTKVGRNDTAAGASDLGRIDSSVLLENMTIHRVDKATGSDVDYYKFTLGASPLAGDALRFRSSVDGMNLGSMVARLYTSAGQAVGNPTATSDNGVLSLAGLVAGRTYWLRITSEGTKALPNAVPTIYSLEITLQGLAYGVNTRDFSNELPVSNSNVLLGGAGNDVLTGGLGEDWIFGGAGDDVISGGDDRMASDLLFGDAGADVFLIAPTLLPDGTTVGTFTGGDMIDGGPDESFAGRKDVVRYVGAAGKDYVAFGYDEFHNIYKFTSYVRDAAGTGWEMVKGRDGTSTGAKLQKYYFFQVGRMDALQFDLGDGDDVFHADSDQHPMDDKFSYGIEEGSFSPLAGLEIYGGGGDDYLTGGGGYDKIYGDKNVSGLESIGDDDLNGDRGGDTVEGGRGDDYISGGRGYDELRGGDGADHIEGDDWDPTAGESDYIFGDAGDDRLFGNGGSDYIEGGENDDYIDGESGGDYILGGDGRDTIRGGSGVNSLYGEGNDDDIDGGSEVDYIYGGAGNDTINGGGGNDVIYGDSWTENTSDGSDRIWGGVGADVIHGGGRDDRISGDDGTTDGDNDTIYGGSGADTIFGNGGADQIRGEAGNDSIEGGTGDDRIWGGGGADTLDGNEDQDYIYGDDASATGPDDGNDVIWGGLGGDTIWGGGGNDKIRGDRGTSDEGSRDVIGGDAGDDTLYGNGGNDELQGGPGDDELYGQHNDDDIWGDSGNDYIEGDEGNDWIDGGTGADEIHGYGGNDYIIGGPNPPGTGGISNYPDMTNKLYGGEGNDTIYGGWAGDFIYGNQNNDYLVGGSGPDEIYGHSGNDQIWGEGGDDTIYSNDNERDTIAGGPGYDVAYYDSDLDSRGNTIESLVNALRATDGAPAEGSHPALSVSAIQAILDEALARWGSAGIDRKTLDAMRRLAVRVEDLPEGVLAASTGDSMVVDDDAAGYGWFVDPTPGEDAEFASGAADVGQKGRMDLLSAVAHELGHILGHHHEDDLSSVMHGEMTVGVRRMPTQAVTASPVVVMPGVEVPQEMITPPRPPVPSQSGVRAFAFGRGRASRTVTLRGGFLRAVPVRFRHVHDGDAGSPLIWGRLRGK